MQHHFNVYLIYNVNQAKKKGKIAEDDRTVPPILETDIPALTRLDAVHNGIEDFYRNVADGYGFEWWADRENSIGGKLQFVSTEYLFSDSTFYEEGDNEELKYFHPLDHPTPEISIGFIIKPDTIYRSMYYLTIDYELYDLDLDYEGYTQMAIESRVFNYWQKVLLYYMGEMSTGSFETERFKTEMPKIFPDWTWENFIDKFESLRLSNKE